MRFIPSLRRLFNDLKLWFIEEFTIPEEIEGVKCANIAAIVRPWGLRWWPKYGYVIDRDIHFTDQFVIFPRDLVVMHSVRVYIHGDVFFYVEGMLYLFGEIIELDKNVSVGCRSGG